ncbi:MAG: hypothetical protein ACTSPY_04800 [Candidatus Helarchaeota archaeon]
MIKKLFIIDESSANLFTYAPLERKRDDIQDQLVTGFITANVSFCEAVMGSGINSVRVSGDRLMFFKDKSKLIIAAIVDVRDSVKLLKKVMDEILKNFLTHFKKELSMKNIDFSRTDKARDFKYFIDDICEKYITSRDTLKNFLAITAGVFISFFLTFLFLNPALQIFNNLLSTLNISTIQADIQSFGFVCFVLQMIIFASLSPGSFICGLIAGDRKYGRITAFIHYGILILLEIIFYLTTPFYIFLNELTVYFIIYLLLVFVPSIILILYFLGDFGGYITTQLKLYPLEELKMKAHEYVSLNDEII